MLRVEKAPSGCWLWKGSTFNSGYGRLTVEGKTVAVHRFFHEQIIGPIPPGMVVMHECDVKTCVNPSHLRAATQKENIRDCIDKGRAKMGGRHAAKLNLEEVQMVRDALAEGAPQSSIARRFGVSQPTVSNIKRGVVDKAGVVSCCVECGRPY